MVIEREFKFLARLDDCPLTPRHITQQYLGNGIRIRKIHEGETTSHYLTVKIPLAVPDVQANVEFECQIDEREFNMVWKDDHPTISKTRYSTDGKYHWDIDDFGDFIMAECEVPEGATVGEAIRDCPPFLTLYNDVSRDPQYSNYNLARKR